MIYHVGIGFVPTLPKPEFFDAVYGFFQIAFCRCSCPLTIRECETLRYGELFGFVSAVCINKGQLSEIHKIKITSILQDYRYYALNLKTIPTCHGFIGLHMVNDWLLEYRERRLS